MYSSIKKHSIVFLMLFISFSVSCEVSDKNNIVEKSISYPVIRHKQPQPSQTQQEISVPISATSPFFKQEEISPVVSFPPLERSLGIKKSKEIFVQSSKEISLLEEKIGQMLIVGFRGAFISDKGVLDIIRDIKKYHLGGVILFDYDIALRSSKRNIQSPLQVKSLVEWLQAASPTMPLFIAIDEEGGNIHRLKKKFGFRLATISAQRLGWNVPILTYKHASKIARTLSELGINFNFAPVVDLNINTKNPAIGKLQRSFSKNPKTVTQHALKFIEAHHEQRVLCALKHFPGHGSSKDDSHIGFVDVTNTWHKIELEPYQKIISLGKADAIMTAHVFNRRFDEKYPATLSKNIIGGILRDRLNYEGVVVSDDMQMKAITQHYKSTSFAIQAALKAGIDILVIGNNLEYDANIVRETVDIIRKLIKKNSQIRKQVRQSLERIEALKKRLPQYQQYQAIVKQKKKDNSSCRGYKKNLLTIQTTPIDSQIKLVNIKPMYQRGGLCLKPGWYAISIMHPGYWESKHWVGITDHDVFMSVTLKSK
ncbi:glycoside hydrolase family 3 protein [Candidatus Parabeggiatoa sp. HSG14]|uniref:glycoside hydrolase family 3 protein n=1 Tax=Candidatus Parabeggiatoa sp. HSG14 TaxID=3055593 RepID=UPI0025A91F6B|nr:glycoside hydrolase family 3 protein [Thiotrichales bacterium HSG14]